MSVEDKVEALMSNLKTSNDELLEFMSAVQRHARTYQWEEGGYVYNFCKFYQKDLKDLVQYLTGKSSANEKRAKQVVSQNTLVASPEIGRTANNPELSGEVPQTKQQADTQTVSLPSQSVHNHLSNSSKVESRSWVSYISSLLGLGGDEPISVQGEQIDSLPPPASSEFESSGKTAIGYARAVACLFVPCDLAVRLATSLSARIMGGREL
jgi:hypothetical protein